MISPDLKQRLRVGDVSAEAVGNRVRMIRLALRLTQVGLGHVFGCAGNVVQHIERGKTYPRPHFVAALMALHHVDHNFIFAGDASRLPVEIADALERQAVDAPDSDPSDTTPQA